MGNDLINFIKMQIEAGNYETSYHAEEEREEEDISLIDIKNVIMSGAVIEDYPNDPRGESCLICGLSLDDRPIHIVCGYREGVPVRIITTYRPQPPRWVTPIRRGRKNEPA